ncbi:unnamed protein product [Allacma fusca]|uniref:Uncharacterized protein n=1 Tax=Allacma fusca TaxID=39272 RepID=A0A8J2PC76_9HEXA|nr:unnamed protein product [Allacma fusca]
MVLSFRSRTFKITPSRIIKECMNCRTMQLNINLFNDLNAHIIFAVKIYWLAVAIENYYFGIKFFSKKPMHAAGLLWLGIFHTFLFSTMYDKAFSVPQKMRHFKQEIQVVAMKLSDKAKRDEVRRFIRSIPLVGVKVGSFHKLERESTPNYVDYIAEKVSGLLITFG